MEKFSPESGSGRLNEELIHRIVLQKRVDDILYSTSIFESLFFQFFELPNSALCGENSTTRWRRSDELFLCLPFSFRTQTSFHRVDSADFFERAGSFLSSPRLRLRHLLTFHNKPSPT